MMIVWILSWLAIVLTIGFFLSGFLTCKSMVDKKSTNNVPFLPFITTFMNCVLWTTYGFMKEDSTLVFVNSVGASLQVLYMLCFLYISKEKTPQLKFIGCVAIAGFVVYFYMAKMITEHNTRTSQLGKLCTVVTIMMQASPLATVAAVVKTKSTESMPFVFSFMITLVSFIWLCYGIAVQDLNIQLPNASGVLLGLLQLSLFCIYPSRPPSPPRLGINIA